MMSASGPRASAHMSAKTTKDEEECMEECMVDKCGDYEEL